ncbi:replication/maintenance protein RepL [Helicobacter bizzozeronii]|uniref:replication/maintenance protein RepL n=1 Tax=Helicobacter bizzozeronii TaxID=56877 RepID=UPI000CEF0492|nr:replication/maintenance protein RepL [Helicobacter bizzozeronii]
MKHTACELHIPHNSNIDENALLASFVIHDIIKDGMNDMSITMLKACIKVIELRDRENSVFVTGEKLAKLCGISQLTAQKALKTLVEKKVLQPLTAHGGAYRLNTKVVFIHQRAPRES